MELTFVFEDKNKQKAVALSYNGQIDTAPKVIAKGEGRIAANIIRRAEEYQIPITSEPSLVELVSKLDINQTIPEELYQVVAELFAFIYQIDQTAKTK